VREDAQSNAAIFPPGPSDAARLIRDHAWETTPLGPIDGWPPLLRSVTSMMVLSPCAMAIMWGEDGMMLYNDGYAAVVGERHPKLIGRPVRDAWPEVGEFADHIMQVVMGGGTLSYRDHELLLLRNGKPEQVWANLDYSPLFDERDIPVGVIAMLTDTTSRVLAERRMYEGHERLHAMFDQSPGFIALMEGPEHTFVLVNKAYRRLMENRPVIGQPVRIAVPEAVPQGFVTLLDNAYRSGEAFVGTNLKFYVDAGDGEISDHFLDFVYQPIRDREGNVTGIFAQGSDVTERVINERALRKSQQEYHRLNKALIMANDILSSHAPKPE
jgi:PAS domain S-box-containing protein